VAPAVDVIAGEEVPIKLALWYGINTALVLSLLTMVLGAVGVWQADAIRDRLSRLDTFARRGPQAVYHAVLRGLPRLAAWQTAFFEGGSLRTYLGATLTVVVALVGGTYLALAGPVWAWVSPDVQLMEGAVLIVTGAAAFAVAVAQSRMAAVTALGVVGVGVALIFVLFSAPDLAMTQFLVEILIVVIVLLVMQHLPETVERAPWRQRIRDALLALTTGGLVTTLVLAVHNVPLSLHLSDYFGETAVPEGFGRNVVNVILVDFRALDTLGEIAVIAMAAVGAFVLVKMNTERTVTAPALRDSVVLQTGTRLLMAVLLLASLFMLWRGHNEPGGGFIGGLVAAAALVLYTIAYRQSGTEEMLRVAPRTLIGGGLGLALVSGLLAVAQGRAYLTGKWMSLETGSGVLKLGTPLLFDVGVFFTVVGVVLMMVLAMERISTVPATTKLDHRDTTDRPTQSRPSVLEVPKERVEA
jgi:multicomponent Na+:H+ antiporter subunit A